MELIENGQLCFWSEKLGEMLNKSVRYIVCQIHRQDAASIFLHAICSMWVAKKSAIKNMAYSTKDFFSGSEDIMMLQRKDKN